jgi:excisionase family DNA binding protein
MALSIAQLAERLGVSPSRARNLVAHGLIKAERVGNHWVVDESDAARYQPRAGRPLSGLNAWRMAKYAADGRIPDIHPMEKSRLRGHLVSLLDAPDPAAKLRSLLAGRAEKAELSSSPADLAELREDPRLRLSGVSHPDSGLLSNSELEAYVSRKDFEAVVKDWYLVKARAGQRSNVLLHVAEEVPDELPPLVVAADLAERPGVREQQAAREIIGSIHAG